MKGLGELGEGLSVAMVRTWLREQSGIKLQRSSTRAGGEWVIYAKDDGMRVGSLEDLLLDNGLEIGVHLLAEMLGRDVNDLLREMNPRMSVGWPSAEDRSRYEYWLCQPEGCLPMVMKYHRDFDVFRGGHGQETVIYETTGHTARFWPVDSNGNKLPRPSLK